VGHVLGIGDRHCSNILVHEKSGEVVHIDFGYVFEQGKVSQRGRFSAFVVFILTTRSQLLAIPEKVPFRLTRNVTDGMGITGTDGLFTKISESTMYLLKSNTNALLTILSAMASDPLYKWSLSPMKIRNRGVTLQNRKKKDDQDDNFDPKEKNKAAARAISRVHEKLQGYEDGTAGEQQSVEGQVQLLINSARDHGNLSSMYPGWQPWV
jgi:ataxia telangiectasia mutated family protein